MRTRLWIRVGIAAAVAAGLALVIVSNRLSGQEDVLRTPWGDPDLQGIWTAEFDTPLERSPRYGTREFFTDAERA